MPRGVFVRHRSERHGQARTRTYKSWASAKSRCCDQANPKFPLYGGIGVRMCQRWKDSFLAFLADVGERPSSAHSLDRFPNPSGDYEPGNVRWATSHEQRRNRRDGCKLTPKQAQEIRDQKGQLTQKELAGKYGISRTAVSAIQVGRIYQEEYRGEK